MLEGAHAHRQRQQLRDALELRPRRRDQAKNNGLVARQLCERLEPTGTLVIVSSRYASKPCARRKRKTSFEIAS